MADIDIPQAEADALIAMEKQCVENITWLFPEPGGKLAIPLVSPDKRENFMLDITRAQIKLTKATYQNRARQAIILMRLDVDGPPHTNPDVKKSHVRICIPTAKVIATNGLPRFHPGIEI
jgi:hypothetical protein